MNCSQIQKLLDAHHDGELDAANTLQIDEHLADCPSCFATSRRLSMLTGALKNQNLRFTAPADLRQAISAATSRQAKTERESVFVRPWFLRTGWVAAAILLPACLLTLHFSTMRRGDDLVAELAASHVRSLMANHLMDVASTDRHTVKPWFDGKLDFAPPVKDLVDSGFPLLGGRLDFLRGRSAAALVYGRQKHYLNLFIQPAASLDVVPAHASQYHGYNVIQWADGAMTYAVISDLNAVELQEFVRDWSGK
jgi:anti-sigma factor RsiW